MWIQTAYMSFKNRLTVSHSYDFQAHQQSSKRRWFSQTALQWFEVLPGWSSVLPCMSLALPGLSSVLPGLSSALPGLSSALPGLALALPDLLSALPDFSLALPGALRCTQSSLQRTEVFSNSSQSLPWYSCTSHQRSQLLWRPAGMPS